MSDLNTREILVFAPLVVAAFWIGLYPMPFMNLMEAPVKKLVEQANPQFYEGQRLEEIQRKAAAMGMKGMTAPAAHGAGHPAAPAHGEAPHAPANPGGH